MTSAAEVAREEEADQEDLVVEGTIESADDSTITLKDRRRNLYTECTDRPEGNKRRYQSWHRSRSNLLR